MFPEGFPRLRFLLRGRQGDSAGDEDLRRITGQVASGHFRQLGARSSHPGATLDLLFV